MNLDGQVPRTFLTGELTDISHVCNFSWYEWVKFRRIRPGSCGKSVIFPHLVGFHSSWQKIYETIQLDHPPLYSNILQSPPPSQKKT